MAEHTKMKRQLQPIVILESHIAEKLKLVQAGNTALKEHKWIEILEDEDFDLLILELREELITRVLDECTQNYLGRTCFKYVVDCAYEAWKKLVNVNYFVHDNVDEVFRSDSTWIPDQEPEICESDSWSSGNILLKKYNPPKQSVDEVKTVLSDYQLIKCLEYPPDNVYESYVSMEEMPCLSEALIAPLCIHPGTSLPDFGGSHDSLMDDVFVKSSLLLTSVASENEFEKLVAQVKVKLPEYATSRNLEFQDWVNADLKVEEANKLSPVNVRLDVKARLRLPPIDEQARDRSRSTSTIGTNKDP